VAGLFKAVACDLLFATTSSGIQAGADIQIFENSPGALWENRVKAMAGMRPDI
jgi:hypothetical protein